jgi:hypothetical protein
MGNHVWGMQAPKDDDNVEGMSGRAADAIVDLIFLDAEERGQEPPLNLTWHEMVEALNPAWRECPYCHSFHPKGSEC